MRKTDFNGLLPDFAGLNITEYLAIHSNYLSDERDFRVAVDLIKIARKIAEADALSPHNIDENVPGRQFQTVAELLEAARRYSQTIYQPVGTCKMGHDKRVMISITFARMVQLILEESVLLLTRNVLTTVDFAARQSVHCLEQVATGLLPPSRWVHFA